MKRPNLSKWHLVIIASVIVMTAGFYSARYFVANELIITRHQVVSLQQDIKDALQQLESERALRTIAERDADVVRRANELLRQSERDRQDEISNLQAELAFYRRLGGASGSQAPLAVHYLEMQATQSPRVYRMVFTLTQNLRWAAVISGQVELGLDGIHDGVATYLTQEELLTGSVQPLKFKFKYFQQFEHLITLPEGFEANRLTIRLRSGVLREPVEQSLPWQSLFKHPDRELLPETLVESASED